MPYELFAIRAERSSMMFNLIPLPFGREIHELPLPSGAMTITLLMRVQKLLPVESFTWMISYDPGCFSRLVITPTRPVLFPPLIMHIAPASNLQWFSIFPDSKFTRTVSCALTSGFGNRIVRPSCVVMYGLPPGPNSWDITRQSLYAASSL